MNEARLLREESHRLQRKIAVTQQDLRRTIKAVEKTVAEIKRTRPTGGKVNVGGH